jgi:nucleoside-triphosphatase THEP1
MDCDNTSIALIDELRRKNVEGMVFEKIQKEKNRSMASICLIEAGETMKFSNGTIEKASEEQLSSGKFCNS